MHPNVCQIHIRKEALKFSAGHMTVFPDGTKEALHGHNYTVQAFIDLKDTSLEKMISFSQFKELLKELCEEWDEKVLIAKACPFLEIQAESQDEIEFKLCNKRYILPRDETVLLEIENITAENLAVHFCQRFSKKLDPHLLEKIAGFQIKIEESPGQGASSSWVAPSWVK